MLGVCLRTTESGATAPVSRPAALFCVIYETQHIPSGSGAQKKKSTTRLLVPAADAAVQRKEMKSANSCLRCLLANGRLLLLVVVVVVEWCSLAWAPVRERGLLWPHDGSHHLPYCYHHNSVGAGCCLLFHKPGCCLLFHKPPCC
jgi:hypothetical protein